MSKFIQKKKEEKENQLGYQLSKVWKATVKLLKHLVEKGKCTELPYAGKFLKQGNIICYQPALDFLTSCKLKFIENENNISPLGKHSTKFQTAETLSLTSISSVCGLDRERTALCLKSIFSEFVSTVRSGKGCELQLGFGKIFCSTEVGIRFIVQDAVYPQKMDYESQLNAYDQLPKGQDKNLETKSYVSFGSRTSSLSKVSVKTPFTTITSKKSVYRGLNKTIVNWYQNNDQADRYSQFSKFSRSALGLNQSSRLSQTDLNASTDAYSNENREGSLMQSLKQNNFIPQQTFDEFIRRQKKGKRRHFLRSTDVDPKSAYQDYVNCMESRRKSQEQERNQRILEENIKNEQVKVESETIKQIESQKRRAKTILIKLQNNVIKEEKDIQKLQEKQSRLQPPFIVFPFTGGDEVEKLQAQLREERKLSMVNQLMVQTVYADESLEEPQLISERQSDFDLDKNGAHRRSWTQSAQIPITQAWKKEKLTQKFLQQGTFQERSVKIEPYIFPANELSTFQMAKERFEKKLLQQKLQTLENEKLGQERAKKKFQDELRVAQQKMEQRDANLHIVLQQIEVQRMRQELEKQERLEKINAADIGTIAV